MSKAAIHAIVSPDVKQIWADAAAEAGCSVSALLATLATTGAITSVAKGDDMAKQARDYDREKRRR